MEYNQAQSIVHNPAAHSADDRRQAAAHILANLTASPDDTQAAISAVAYIDQANGVDGLEEVITAPLREITAPAIAPQLVEGAVFEEACPKCRGSGRFYSWSGRLVGNCHTCRGSGKIAFKTSSQARAKARASRVARQEKITAEVRQSFADLYPAQWAWIVANQDNPRFDFARRMRDAVDKFGSLTTGQLAAIDRLMTRDADREAAKAATLANAPTADIAKIESAFRSAQESGLKWPFLLLDAYKFTLAGPNSRNPGAVYVKSTESGLYLGKVAGGKFLKSRDCSGDDESRIVAACADPATAAKVYGKRTGRCSCCARELTNPESIAAGIGPICAQRFHF